ncbi:MAG TPA: LamG domain-containing protein [Kiritimatiellia bacterium]|nr:LamG domain-containing protein [Kiritimatiellia bacterium]HRZ12560.1 LamG domain-containing protein [Kiritimatiellia bacterium]HSA17638.1 LamG domain-containing protein [Kiritimatiellia bacterium]
MVLFGQRPGRLGAALLLGALALPAGGQEAARIAYYPFDGDATDGSGNSRDGEIRGAAAAADRFAFRDQALRFDGQNDYVAVPDTGLAVGGDFSIAFWARSIGRQKMYVFGLGAPGGANLDLEVNDESSLWAYWNGGGSTGIRIESRVTNLVEDFSGFAVTNSTLDLGSNLNAYLSTTGWTGSKVFSDGGRAKLGSSAAHGSLTTPSLDLDADLGRSRLLFDLVRWTSDTAVIQVLMSTNGAPFQLAGGEITAPDIMTRQTLDLIDGAADTRICIQAKWTNQCRFKLDNVHISKRADTYEFTDGLWHHVAVCRSGAEVRVYSDGILRETAAQAGAIGASGPLLLGCSSSTSAFWYGEIDDVGLWNRALSEAEVLALSDDRLPEAPWRWTQVQHAAAFSSRDGAGDLVFDGRLWLLGGWAPETEPDPYTLNEVWVSSNGADWAWVTNAPWEPRHTAGYAVHDGKMWVLGGDANRGHYQNDVWSSTNGADWVQVAATVPWSNRVLHYATEFNGCLWVMGGQELPQLVPGTPTNAVFYNDVWRSTNGADWVRVLDHAPWSPRGMISGRAVLSNQLWLVGGGTYQTPNAPDRQYFNDVWSTADGSNWTCATPGSPWQARLYHRVGVYANRLWITGGAYDQNLNDVWFSADGASWLQLAGTPWPPRHAHSLYLTEAALWITAGSSNDLFCMHDVWRLDSTNAAAWPEPPPLAIDGPATNRMWLGFEGEQHRTYSIELNTNLLSRWEAWQLSSAETTQRVVELDLDAFGPRNFFRLVWPYYVLRPE